MVDQSMNPVLQQDGSEMISNSMDFSSLLPVGDRIFSVTQFESRPGGMYLSELEQDETTGELTSIATRPIDFSGVDGLWVPCAGSVTPWNTHLGSEEYPRDGRTWESLDDADSLSVISAADGGYTVPMFRYYGIDIYTDADSDTNIDATVGDVRAVYNPYMHGYATEVAVDAAGDYEVTKHYAMGRMALELAYVMPDQRTVYLTDDGTNVGLFMFVADEPGDLSSGRLYAMKWNQVSTINGGRADIEWIPLDTGSVDAGLVDDAIHDDDVQFSDMFEVEDPTGTGDCPGGFTAVMRTSLSGRTECLRVRAGMQDLASRLETTRMAAYLGATTELRKEEGITYDFENETLYLAMSAVERGMTDGHSNDAMGPNHVRLPENECGVVYALPTGNDGAIGSRYVAKRFIGVVAGMPIDSDPDNSCSLDGIASPDNVTFMDGHGILIIGEDTGSGHQNDVIWAYDVYEGSLTRIQTTPYGSETTSPYWYPNINGFAYLKSVIQHPFGESDSDMLMSPDEARAYDGYVGPFPAIE
ncbi:MAG: DUF839 domain-containing protein [Deltaproteobacteria bacterium]|nr:DUF839 domain-containing protein [Deltaproteobacteria bacterium]